MREVLISIQPRWVEKIVRGEKTVEVRRTRPKCEVPFKVYIYQTKESKRRYTDHRFNSLFSEKTSYNSMGKVIGEFVCDRITEYECSSDGHGQLATTCETCLTYDEIINYCNGNELYGWHITDLVVYDEPRELRDFKPYNRTEEDCKFSHLGLAIPKCKDCRECYVKRPYQSWGYVEATEPRQTAD